jgi:PAS domain S-box-containing protein
LDIKPNELELFFSVSLDMLCIADNDGCLRLLNPEWERTLGYQLSELIGQKFIDFVHPEDVKATIEVTKQLAQRQKVINFVNRYRHKDGSYRWIEWRSYPVDNLIYAAARDITTHKAALEELNKSDLWLRASQKNSHIGSYNLNIAEGFWKSSAELDTIFGISSDYTKDVEGWTNLIHPDHLDEMVDHLLQHVIQKRNQFDKEYRIVRPNDGMVRWVHGLGNIYYDSSGNPASMIGTIQDVTDKKIADEALLKSERKYRLLFENMSSGFALQEMMYDDSGKPIDFRYIYVNPKFKELWDVTTDIEGKTVKETFPYAQEKWIQNLHKVAVTKAPNSHINYLSHKDVCLEFIEFWVDENQVAVLFNDITKRKKAEEEIARNESRLQSLIKIMQNTSGDTHTLLDFALEEALRLTQSKFGCIFYCDENKKELVLHSWSKEMMEESSIADTNTRYEYGKTGIWGESVRQRKPIMINDVQLSNPSKKEDPFWHAAIFKFLSIPIFINREIVALIGVANKPRDYISTDILQLTLLIDSIWKIIAKQRRSEKYLSIDFKHGIF